MLFYLITLHLAKFLQEDPPEPGTDRDSILAVMHGRKVISFAETIS